MLGGACAPLSYPGLLQSSPILCSGSTGEAVAPAPRCRRPPLLEFNGATAGALALSGDGAAPPSCDEAAATVAAMLVSAAAPAAAAALVLAAAPATPAPAIVVTEPALLLMKSQRRCWWRLQRLRCNGAAPSYDEEEGQLPLTSITTRDHHRTAAAVMVAQLW